MSEVIPAEAVEAAAKVHQDLQAKRGHPDWEELGELGTHAQNLRLEYMRAALEAAAPYIQQEVDLMRWKLNVLSKWAVAMIDESYYPQYGRDVKTILDVKSMEESREIDAL